jgi:hypothetical protein
MADEQTSEPKSSLEAADDLLKSFEAEQAKELGNPPAPKTDDTLPPPDRAGESDDTPPASTDLKEGSDTPSEAEKQEVDKAKIEAEKEGKELELDEKGAPKRDAKGQFVRRDKPAPEPVIKLTPDEQAKFTAYQKQTGSKYQHDLAKKLVRWDNIKTEEARVAGLVKEKEAALATAYDKFKADVNDFRAQQEAARPTPEKYESYAQKCQSEATVKEAEAIKAENEGDNDKAAKLRAEAVVLKADAGRATQAADFARKNPPLTAQQQQQQFQTHQRQWIDKAAIDFPEFGKKDSVVQKEATEYFQAMAKEQPAVAKLPGFIYYCAERAAFKTASDRVPALEKELVELRARVKEQDGLLSPSPKGNGGTQRTPAPKTFEQMTPEQQFEELKREAAQIRR